MPRKRKPNLDGKPPGTFSFPIKSTQENPEGRAYIWEIRSNASLVISTYTDGEITLHIEKDGE